VKASRMRGRGPPLLCRSGCPHRSGLEVRVKASRAGAPDAGRQDVAWPHGALLRRREFPARGEPVPRRALS
jgi:hypothetical protein